MNLSSEKAIQFVELVQSYPCLYNNTLPEYARKDFTERAWIEVSEQMDWTINDCKERWRNFRNNFVRSLKGRKRYYLHDHMQFVLQYVKQFKTSEENEIHISYTSRDQFEDTKDIFDEVYLEESTCLDPIVEMHEKPEMPIAKAKKRKKNDGETRYLVNGEMQTPKSSENTKRERRDNYREMFLLSLVPDVEKLTDENFMQFRINSIVDLQKCLLKQSKNTKANSP